MAPYSDPDKQREYKRHYYRRKYQRSSNFRIVEAMRKKPWYNENREAVAGRSRKAGSQAMKPLAAVFDDPDSYLSQFGTLRTWMRWCARGKVPAEKRAGQWFTSVGAINWYLWSCGNEAFKKLYAAPRKPKWWTAKSSS